MEVMSDSTTWVHSGRASDAPGEGARVHVVVMPHMLDQIDQDELRLLVRTKQTSCNQKWMDMGLVRRKTENGVPALTFAPVVHEWMQATKAEELAVGLPTITEPAMHSGVLDTLVSLVEHGPVHDGDITSMTDRDTLITAGLAIRVVYEGEDGYTAATMKGANVYRGYFGEADTLKEAKANRLLHNDEWPTE